MTCNEAITQHPHLSLVSDQPAIDCTPFGALIRHIMSTHSLPWPVVAHIANVDPAVVYELLMGTLVDLSSRDARALLATDDALIQDLSERPGNIDHLRRLVWRLGLRDIPIADIASLIGLTIRDTRMIMAGENARCCELTVLRAQAAWELTAIPETAEVGALAA